MIQVEKVYELLEPEGTPIRHPGEIRYIGITGKSLEERLKRHIGESRRRGGSHKKEWIRSLLDMGLLPVMRIIGHCDSKEEAKKEEKQLIAFYRGCGADLTNTTDGGDGRVGYVCTDEAKKKMAASQQKRWEDPEARRRAAEKSMTSIEIRERIPPLYLGGMNQKQVATELGIGETAVSNELVRSGTPLRDDYGDITPEEQAIVVRLYSEGRTQKQIACEVGLCQRSVCNVLIRLGLPTNYRREERLLFIEPQIRKLHEEGKTQKRIAGELGVSQGCVCSALVRLGLTANHNPGAQPLQIEAQIRKLHAEGLPQNRMARKLGISEHAVRNALIRYGLPIDSRKGPRPKDKQ